MTFTRIQSVVLAYAVLLMFSATMGDYSACPDPGSRCDEYTGIQALARAVVATSPLWLLALAWLSGRYRVAAVALVVAASVLAGVAIVVGSEARSVLRPLGLSNATGLALYTVPFLVVAGAGLVGVLRRATGSVNA